MGQHVTLSSTGAAGNITFEKTVDGGFQLSVNTAGVTTFGGAIGTLIPVAGLITDAAGTTTVQSGTVLANLADFRDDVLLTRDLTITGTTVSFEKTVNSDATARALTVNASGVTTFGGAVGGLAPLASLTTDAAGTTDVNGSPVKAGVVDFQDDVILTKDVTITGTTVTFRKTVNSDATARALAVNAGGVTTFGGAVGGSARLASLTTDAAGSTAINGGSMLTIGSQTYGDPVTLGASTVLGSSAGSLRFDGTRGRGRGGRET